MGTADIEAQEHSIRLAVVVHNGHSLKFRQKWEPLIPGTSIQELWKPLIMGTQSVKIRVLSTGTVEILHTSVLSTRMM